MVNRKSKLMLFLMGGIAAIALACFVIVGIAKAAVETYDFSGSYLTVNVDAPNNATFNATYTYTFDASGFNGRTDAEAKSYMPEIAVQDLSINVTDGKINEQTGYTYYKVGDGATIHDSKTTCAYICQKDLSTFLDKSAFTKAGEYTYAVTQNVKTYSPESTWTHSKATYAFRVYVVNTDTGLKVDGCTVEQTKTDTGTPCSIKKNPTEGQDDKTTPVTEDPGVVWNGFTIKNFLALNSDLEIHKDASGKYADQSYDFEFSLNLHNTDKQGTDTVTAAIVDKDGTVVEEKVFNYNADTSFKLSHGQSLKFASLPVGTTYSYTETGYEDYKTKATTTTTTSSGPLSVNTPEGQSGQGINVAYGDSNKAAIIGQAAGNKSMVTNTKPEISPTDFMVDVLPYVVLIGIPVGACVAWLIYRRRKANNTIA